MRQTGGHVTTDLPRNALARSCTHAVRQRRRYTPNQELRPFRKTTTVTRTCAMADDDGRNNTHKRTLSGARARDGIFISRLLPVVFNGRSRPNLTLSRRARPRRRRRVFRFGLVCSSFSGAFGISHEQSHPSSSAVGGRAS